MDRFKQIETFAAVAAKGSLSAARTGRVAPAIIGRRLDALEERLGVKLLVRTTRKLTLTFEAGVPRGLPARHQRHAERGGERVRRRRQGERPPAYLGAGWPAARRAARARIQRRASGCLGHARPVRPDGRPRQRGVRLRGAARRAARLVARVAEARRAVACASLRPHIWLDAARRSRLPSWRGTTASRSRQTRTSNAAGHSRTCRSA